MDDEASKASDVKITSVEKVKDPKKVEAGKKLGAMSRQAKEKKAASQRVDIDEFQIPPSVNPLAVVGVIGVVGAIVYYKYFRSVVVVKKSVNESESKEDPTPTPQKETSQVEKPKRRELDTLD